MEEPTINELFNDKMNNSSIALSLQKIANSTSQIVGCLVTKSERVKNEEIKQRPKPYNFSSLRARRINGSQEQRRRSTGIFLEHSDLMILNEAVNKLNEVVTRLNEKYENQASSSDVPAAAASSLSPSSTPPPPSDDDIQVLDIPATMDISNPINHIQQEETQLDPLLNISNGLSSCLKPCLIVSKDDYNVYEYTIQKRRCGNEYYCCSSCRKLPSPRSNLVIYSDGKITCSLHNLQCIPISKEEHIKKQEKRQNRIQKGNNNNNKSVVVEE
jgi:hypothetical protein